MSQIVQNQSIFIDSQIIRLNTNVTSSSIVKKKDHVLLVLQAVSTFNSKQFFSFLYGYALSECLNDNKYLDNSVQRAQYIIMLKRLIFLLAELLKHQILTKKEMTEMFFQFLLLLRDLKDSQNILFIKITQMEQFCKRRKFIQCKVFMKKAFQQIKKEKQKQFRSQIINQKGQKEQAQNERNPFQKIVQPNEEQQIESQCQICCMPICRKGNNICLLKCGHNFHMTCAKINYQLLISQGILKLKCPKDECKRQIQQIQLRNIVSPQNLNKLFTRQLNNFAQRTQSIKFCKTPDCKFIYQNQTKNQGDMIGCPLCKQIYCLSCTQLSHGYMTCQQNKVNSNYLKQDQLFQNFLHQKGKKYKRCPKCKFWVQNWRGCSTIKCRCGAQFCYKCGQIGCPHGKCNNIPSNI